MGSQNQYHMTNHACTRLLQRGIKREAVDLVWANGRREHAKNGCTLHFLTRRMRRELRDKGIGVQLPLNIALIVGPNNELLTIYHL